MRAKLLCISSLIFFLLGCGYPQSPHIVKIALVTSFEGRYREIGYDALYAARLALTDAATNNIDILALDDGGSIETAQQRLAALNQDPSIVAVITLGLFSTAPQIQTELDNVPMIIVGNWYTAPVTETVFMLTNPAIDEQLTFQREITQLTTQSDIIGNELLALQQISRLLDDTSSINILSSATPPDPNFTERYLNSAAFTPNPTLLAPLTYDATRLTIQAIQTNTPISEIVYTGIHGQITFEDGYWVEAPIHTYTYDALYDF